MERRLAVGVIVVLLLVVNYVIIWPHFGDWGNLDYNIRRRQTLQDATRTPSTKRLWFSKSSRSFKTKANLSRRQTRPLIF